MTKRKFSGFFIFLLVAVIALLSGKYGFQNSGIDSGHDVSSIPEGPAIKEEVSTTEEQQEMVSENAERLKVYFIDVGQGDSIFVTNNGENMLIDAGNNPDGKLISDYLKKELGVNDIKYLVGTHPHEDHIGGLDDIIEDFNIENIFMPKKSANTKTFEDVLDAVKNKNLKVHSPKIGDKFYLANVECEIMSINNDASDANEASIAIMISYGDVKMLFMGDCESDSELARDWEKVDILKVGHHGSTTSSSEQFLSQTEPDISVISVGKDNDYNHPTSTTLKKLKNIKSNVYRTDEDGTILIITDGKTYEINKIDISCDGN